MKVIFSLALLCLLVAANEAKVFERCELARTLKNAGLGGYEGYSLENWVCMANYESNFNTAAVGPQDQDGSYDYGIFQISSRWWCTNGHGESHNMCHTSCSSFTNDDISDDIECAKRIVRDPNKMGAWVAWRKNCEGKDLSSWTKDCGV